MDNYSLLNINFLRNACIKLRHFFLHKCSIFFSSKTNEQKMAPKYYEDALELKIIKYNGYANK